MLAAALEILADEGLPGLTMESVARRAGAGKGTLYRRWPSRAALLVEAMDVSFEPVPPRRSGDLRSDLVALIRSGEELFGRPPFARLMAAVVDAAERDETLAAVHDQLTTRRRQPFVEVLAAGQQRGDIDPAADLELATDMLAGPLFYRRFVAHRSFPEGYAEAIVDRVLDGIRPR